MDRELDNANPTIFAPKASGSKRTKTPQELLWSNFDQAQEDQEEREAIDAEEVFGTSHFLPLTGQ
jgi:hypothetical protein